MKKNVAIKEKINVDAKFTMSLIKLLTIFVGAMCIRLIIALGYLLDSEAILKFSFPYLIADLFFLSGILISHSPNLKKLSSDYKNANIPKKETLDKNLVSTDKKLIRNLIRSLKIQRYLISILIVGIFIRPIMFICNLSTPEATFNFSFTYLTILIIVLTWIIYSNILNTYKLLSNYNDLESIVKTNIKTEIG